MKGLIHSALFEIHNLQKKKFLRGVLNPGNAQSNVLKSTLKTAASISYCSHSFDTKISSYKEFSKKIPLTNYLFYKEALEREKLSPRNRWVRWEPTSGSTQARKWIPYNQEFLAQLHCASSPWLADIYSSYPSTKAGSHYWSLSWLPHELRQLHDSNDSELFPFWQRLLLSRVFPFQAKMATVRTSESFWFATLVALAGQKDLTLISIWSPTFMLQVLSDIKALWPQIETTLMTGKWQCYQQELFEFKPPKRPNLPPVSAKNFFAELWPKLSLVSCWDSASSSPFAKELSLSLRNVNMQGKGLWATEGVVTIPFQNAMPIAVNSHFYEFQNLDNDKICRVEELRPGMTVVPIISSANGMLRYQTEDILYVDSLFFNTPSMTFKGRKKYSDMVGEKIDYQLALNAIQSLSQHFSGKFFSIEALRTPKPYYRIVCASRESATLISKQLEQILLEIHHYSVARELNQLQSAEALVFDTEEKALTHLFSSSLTGQNKIEPLISKEMIL